MTFPFFRAKPPTRPTPEDALGLAIPRRKQYYRSIWISDTHLGIPEAKAEQLYDFLRHTESDYLYIVGDFVDCWRLRKSWHWPQLYNNIIRTLLGKAKNGAEVIYIPGNHDEVFREFAGMALGDIRICREALHRTADVQRLLVLHGDEFDSIVLGRRWLAHLGSTAYAFALKANRWLNAIRRQLGLPYWSLSAYLKHRVKNAVQCMDDFEAIVAREARRRRVDGIVCGHIHRAATSEANGIAYRNDGDWVESCTALVEHDDGTFEVLHWLDEIDKRETEEADADRHRVRRLVAAG